MKKIYLMALLLAPTMGFCASQAQKEAMAAEDSTGSVGSQSVAFSVPGIEDLNGMMTGILEEKKGIQATYETTQAEAAALEQKEKELKDALNSTQGKKEGVLGTLGEIKMGLQSFDKEILELQKKTTADLLNSLTGIEKIAKTSHEGTALVNQNAVLNKVIDIVHSLGSMLFDNDLVEDTKAEDLDAVLATTTRYLGFEEEDVNDNIYVGDLDDLPTATFAADEDA